MSDKNGECNPTKNEDELNDLLDNALRDFENCDKTENSTDQEVAVKEVPELWDEQFFTEQAQLLGERVNAIFGAEGEAISTDQIAVGFQKMAEAAAIALQGEVPNDEAGKKYAESISGALKGLREGVNNLQAPISESDIATMFSSLNVENEDREANPFLPFMQGMMQSLLSAEILLPSIKDLLEKYPKYLEENAANITPADKERFSKQQELFEVICRDLEAEKADDSQSIKQERFKRVLDNMQKLHEYGQPPEDLIGDIGPGVPNLSASDAGNQCPLM